MHCAHQILLIPPTSLQMMVTTLSLLTALKHPAKTRAIFLSCFYHQGLR